jgi:predicted component of type VI protein secretion system
VDLDPFAGRSGPSRQTFLRLVRETIEAYEPRLRNVDVELVGPAREAGRLILRITAELAVDEVCEALDFDWSPGDGAGSMGNDGSS